MNNLSFKARVTQRVALAKPLLFLCVCVLRVCFCDVVLNVLCVVVVFVVVGVVVAAELRREENKKRERERKECEKRKLNANWETRVTCATCILHPLEFFDSSLAKLPSRTFSLTLLFVHLMQMHIHTHTHIQTYTYTYTWKEQKALTSYLPHVWMQLGKCSLCALVMCSQVMLRGCKGAPVSCIHLNFLSLSQFSFSYSLSFSPL